MLAVLSIADEAAAAGQQFNRETKRSLRRSMRDVVCAQVWA